MGSFSNLAVTQNGQLLLSHVHAGAVLIPTKIVIGSGALPAGTTTDLMSAEVAPVKELTINKVNRSNDGKVTFGGMYSNGEISTPFYFRELSLHCRGEYRDTSGNVTKALDEVLFVYGNAGDTADYMPAYDSGQPVERQIDLVVYIGNSAAVSLEVSSGLAITKEEFENHVTEFEKFKKSTNSSLAGKAPADHNHDSVYTKATEFSSYKNAVDKNISDINTALDGKSPTGHTHTLSSLGAAPVNHSHTLEALGAAAAGHNHDTVYVKITDLNSYKSAVDKKFADVNTALDGKSPTNHTHTPASLGAAAANHNHDSSYLSQADFITHKNEFSQFENAVNQTFTQVEGYLENKSDKGHNHDYENIYPASVEITPPAGEGHGGYIDFHYNRSNADYTARLIEGEEGVLMVNNSKIVTGENIIVVKNLEATFVNGSFAVDLSVLPVNKNAVIFVSIYAMGPSVEFRPCGAWVNIITGKVEVYTDYEFSGTVHLNIMAVNL